MNNNKAVTATFSLKGNILKGDVNGDGQINLADAVLSLQIISRLTSSESESIYKQADVDGNQKIGLEEVIYILQKISGLRNLAPAANAGADRNIGVGALVTLDGSGSSDPDHDVLVYNWSVVSKPEGSVAALSGSATASPTFTPDIVGDYVISLVVSDGFLSSATDTVTITAVQRSSDLNTIVVGAWSVQGSVCGTTIKYVFIICPKGRLRGAEVLNGWEFVDCGTWSIVDDKLVLNYKCTAVADRTVTGTQTWTFQYEVAGDNLRLVGNCAFPLFRAVGGVTESDCTSATCTGGGSGNIQCGTDCDCGRCWYCESGTCRYGGEGTYGCFRGCF
jgi:hypothetical protein